MSIFAKATNQQAYLKMGLYGEPGCGKTFTASSVAIGLVQHTQAKKPVFFLDTETGSDFVLGRFQEAGIELQVGKSRAFKDALEAIKEAEMCGSVLVMDSMTHVWNEIIQSYMKANEIKRLTLKHWQPIKQTWRELTERYLNSKLHVIICGRSQDKWDEVEDEDGAKELRKTGTKMRTETEMGYEPSLLVEMELVQATGRIGSELIHRAHVRKDRFNIINGQHFDNPDFETFLPHIALLNLGGEHKALESGRDSTELFERGDTGAQKMLAREIIVEKAQAEITLLCPGQTAADKTAKVKLIEEAFGTKSWTEVEKKVPVDKLREGLALLEAKNAAAGNGNGKEKSDGAVA